MQRVIVIHQWGGNPEKDFLPWLKKELSKKGYDVIAPLMPDTDHPKITPWTEKLREVVGEVYENDILIGHSVGCQTILRFLESLPEDKKISSAILIAPWLELTNLSNDAAWEIAKPWIETPIDFKKVKIKAENFIAIFSDDDKWVPLEENKSLFIEKLNPQIIVEDEKGHFSDADGVKELSVILKYF